jgi:hypothetical protein
MDDKTFTRRWIERTISELRLRTVTNTPISAQDVAAACRIPIHREDIIETFVSLDHCGKVTCRATVRCGCPHEHVWSGPAEDLKLALTATSTREFCCKFCTLHEAPGSIDVSVTVSSEWEDEIYREVAENKLRHEDCEDTILVIFDIIDEKRGRVNGVN